MRNPPTLRIAAASFVVCAFGPASAAELSLRFQESSSLGQSGITASFDGYLDHRCPREVQCVVPGVAHVWLWVSAGPAQPQLLSVSWPNGSALSPQKDSAFGSQFCFASLEPRRSAVAPGRSLFTRGSPVGTTHQFSSNSVQR